MGTLADSHEAQLYKTDFFGDLFKEDQMSTLMPLIKSVQLPHGFE